MASRSIDIALTQEEAGDGIETVYENFCTLATEPELCFNYATTGDLNNWGFAEGCFSCFLKDKKDVIIQVITTYQSRDGANNAYNADVDYFSKNGYGKPVKTKTLGESSTLFKKRQSDGVTYNLLFFKSTVFASISAKYKKERAENLNHVIELAEKVEGKIQE